MNTMTLNLRQRIEEAMRKAGSRFASEEEFLSHTLDLYDQTRETKEERMERTRQELNAWIRDRQSTPHSEYVQPPTLEELKARYAEKQA